MAPTPQSRRAPSPPRPTKRPAPVSPLSLRPSSPALSLVASSASASVNHLARYPNTPRGGHSEGPRASLIHATHSITSDLPADPSPKSACLPSISLPRSMGLLKGVKNAVKHVGSRRKEKEQNAASTSLCQHSDGITRDDKAPPEPELEPESEPEPEPDESVPRPQPQAPPIEFKPKPQQKPHPQLEQALKQPVVHPYPQATLQPKPSSCRPQPELQTKVQLDVEPETETEYCGSDCQCDQETDPDDPGSETESRPDAGSLHLQAPDQRQGPQQVHSYTSGSDKFGGPYRFPFQNGPQSEDQQSFNSGAIDKASSYRGHGRVDSYALSTPAHKMYNSSIRAEVVSEQQISRENLRKPTLRAQREVPPVEKLQYHGIDDLDDGSEDDEPLFATSQRKFSVEPDSPTSQPRTVSGRKASNYHAPTVESVADYDGSETPSDAESEVSELRLDQPQVPQRRPGTTPLQHHSRNRKESTVSFDTVGSAEWMKGALPSSFYPHPEEPDAPAGLSRHLARNRFGEQHRRATYHSHNQYPAAKRPVNGRRNLSSGDFPDPDLFLQRLTQAKEVERQKERLRAEQQQRAEEKRRQERANEIAAARIAELEYEKRELAKRNGQISLQKRVLEETCSKLAARFSEKHRRLTELEMQEREREDFEAQCKNNPSGPLTPPDSGSWNSSPGNPERVMAWTETLSDPALLSSESLRVKEALQEQETLQEFERRRKALAAESTNDLPGHPDAANARSSPTRPVQLSQLCHNTLPDMPMEYAVRSQTSSPAHKLPKTRLYAFQPGTSYQPFAEPQPDNSIYAVSNDTRAAFGSEHHPLRCPEEKQEQEQDRSNLKPRSHGQEVQPSIVPRQSSQSSLQKHQQRLREPKQVQFESELRIESQSRIKSQPRTESFSRYRRRDVSSGRPSGTPVADINAKQQKKATQSAQANQLLLKQSLHYEQPGVYQTSHPVAASCPNIPALINSSTNSPQNQASCAGNNQIYQRQQFVNYENQRIPVHQPRRQQQQSSHVQRQHRELPIQHAQSYQHLPRPQLSPKVQEHTRPTTSQGHSRPSNNVTIPASFQQPFISHDANAPRPNTSHGPSSRPTTDKNPPRPGTSHSTRGFGGSSKGISTLAPPPMPTIPRHHQIHHQAHLPAARSTYPQHQTHRTARSPHVPTQQQVYHPMAPAAAAAYQQQHHRPGSAAGPRPAPNGVSHQSQLSKMQHRANAGLKQNEQHNASVSAAAKNEGGNGGAQPASSLSSSSTSTSTTNAERVGQARAWDLVGEGEARERQEVAQLRRNHADAVERRRRAEEDRKLRARIDAEVEMERVKLERGLPGGRFPGR